LGGPALPLAISSALRFSCRRAPPITVKRSKRNLSASFALRLRTSQRTLAGQPKPPAPLMGSRSLQRLRMRRSGSRELAGPPPSAFRVWLPSARLTPFAPVSVFSRTDSAPGIHPSELSPPARYLSVSARVDPPTVSPAVATVAGATGRPGGPRFLGFDPHESP
jgi:hypothetical protein